MEYRQGDKVYKISGYRFVGTIVTAFAKLNGDIRYVVENDDGLLHIFNGSQLDKQGPEAQNGTSTRTAEGS